MVRAHALAHASIYICTHLHAPCRIKIRFPKEFTSLLKVFSVAEMSLDLPSTACLLSSVGFYDRLLGYTVLPFVVVVVMVLPTLWARFHKLDNKADKLLNLFFIWSIVFINLIYPSVSSSPSPVLPRHSQETDALIGKLSQDL